MPLIPYKFRPGLGFVLFVLTVLASIVFFRFGLSRPDLDRAYELLTTLEGKPDTALVEGDARLIWGMMREHPQMVHALLEDRPFGFSGGMEEALSSGWAVLMLAPGEDRTLRFSCPLDARVIFVDQDPGVWKAETTRLFPGSGDQYLAFLVQIVGADASCALRAVDP